MKSGSRTHKGHRARLREKVKTSGLKVLSKHEIIELLLTYTIPRKDTNDLGHELCERFGSIRNILSADVVDLKKVDGVGESSAFFLNLLGQLFEIVKQDKGSRTLTIKSTGDIVKYFRNNYEIEDRERFICFVLSDLGKIESAFSFDGKSSSSVEIDKKVFVDNINIKKSSSIIVIHTHPGGSVVPSREDMMATQQLLNISAVLGIVFNDHIVINESSHFSFKENGLLDNMLDKYNQVFGVGYGEVKRRNDTDNDDTIYF